MVNVYDETLILIENAEGQAKGAINQNWSTDRVEYNFRKRNKPNSGGNVAMDFSRSSQF